MATVDLVRQMTDIFKVASLTPLTQQLAQGVKQTTVDTIEQRVAISAEFPNANNAEEIKQALLGLADSAMQYAYRER